MAQTDEASVEKLRALPRRLTLERLDKLRPARVTLDFDGSVLSTGRRGVYRLCIEVIRALLPSASVEVRKKTRFQRKESIQLDLFIPHEYGYDFKVIVTNKTLSAGKLIAYHVGRGSQEGVFAELKKIRTEMLHYLETPDRWRCIGNWDFALEVAR